MIIAIDFDGTCVTHEYPEIGKDIGAQPVLKKLVEHGHKLILYTMRDNKERFIPQTPKHDLPHHTLDNAVQWFRNNNIPLYAINNNPEQHLWTFSPKVYAELYIDDADLGIPLIHNHTIHKRPFVDWEKVEQLLTERGILTIPIT